MQYVSGEILEISLGTPATPDGFGVLCRSTDPLGRAQVFYLAWEVVSRRENLALVLVGIAAIVAADDHESTEVCGQWKRT